MPRQSHGKMLYHKRTKAVIKWVWIVLSVFIIASMIFLYSGGASFI